MSIKITGTGSYIPLFIKKNQDFLKANFLNSDGSKFNLSNEVIVRKFKSITKLARKSEDNAEKLDREVRRSLNNFLS